MFDFIENFSSFLIFDLAWISRSHFWEALNFFVYDTIKILLLLVVITHLMSFINIYFPTKKVKEFLTKNKLFWLEYFFASLFGAITPFCTCSSIPLFIGFLRAGIPLWVTFAFLITSPLVNEVAIAMLLWCFGLKVTMIYVVSWMLLWIIGGFILWKMNLEKYLKDIVKEEKIPCGCKKEKCKSIFVQISKEAFKITFSLMPYIALWVGVWAIIHWYVPAWFFEVYISKNNIFAVPVAVILGIPMYANASSVVPIIQSLVDKWIPLWTALAFMMATVGLSLPEFLILKKVMQVKLLFIFFGLIGFFMIILGYLFNLVF